MSKDAVIEVALVEDDDALREATVQSLQLEGFAVRAFADAASALRVLTPDAASEFAGAVVSDIRMPGMDGIELFARLRESDAEIPVILVTGHGDVEMAVAAMKDGAADFLTKPYSSAALIRTIRSAAKRRALVLENRRLRSELAQRSHSIFIGSSEIAKTIRTIVASVAPSDIDVVIEGDVGTGKSTLARSIHDLGPRSGRPFVTVDAGILAHEDAELLLFGRDPSSGLSRTGLLERANGGTLFLDELEFAADRMHSRLLAMLDSRSVLPLGAERERQLNLRIILARNPRRKAGGNRGSAAFEQRLGALKIALPTLAERRSDLAELFRHFVAVHESELLCEGPPAGEVEWNYIQSHDWPGNLRELSGYARAHVLGVSTIRFSNGETGGSRPLSQMVADFEKALLEDALRTARGSVTALEESLQTPRKTLYDKLTRYNLRPQDFKRGG